MNLGQIFSNTNRDMANLSIAMVRIYPANNKGAPRGWVQDGMYMATGAFLIQFLLGLLLHGQQPLR